MSIAKHEFNHFNDYKNIMVHTMFAQISVSSQINLVRI